MTRREVIGDATLYFGDCREIIPTIGAFAAIVTDPPYGQALKQNTFRKGRTTFGYVPQPSGRKLAMRSNVWADAMIGDDAPFDPKPLLDLDVPTLLWGAHKFGHLLPKGRWLAWDKVPTGKVRDQGDAELAWTNVNPDAAMRMIRLLWDGVCVGRGARHEVTRGQKRVHPTQKPELVMSWSIDHVQPTRGATILDPYMGAGSTGVAALKQGLRFIGIEIVEQYFDTACERMRKVAAAPAQFMLENAT